MTDLSTPISPATGIETLSARYYRNIESFPGQLLVTPPSISARQETKIARKDAVRAARHVERTNEHVRGGIDRKTDMVVGATLRLEAQPDFEVLGITDREQQRQLRRALEREFNSWANDTRCLCDGEGHYNFGGMMRMGYRNYRGPDAECAGVIELDEDRASALRSRWATVVTFIDPARVDTPPELAMDENVFEGRRLDSRGRMIGLYIQKRHPGDSMSSMADNGFTYVPRETDRGRPMAFHYFAKNRPGAQRGLTTLINVLRQATMLDRFSDAKLGSAIKAAVMAPYIETVQTPEAVGEMLAPAGSSGASPFAAQLDHFEKSKFRVGRQRLPIFPPGTKPAMLGTDPAADDSSAFVNDRLRQIAIALGVSFEQLSSNLENVNYSSIRAGILDIERDNLADRTLFTHHVPSLIYSAVIEEAIGKGRIPLPANAPNFYDFRYAYTACTWTGPAFGEVDPQKAAAAQEIYLRLRATTRKKIAASRGEDWEENFLQTAEEIAFAEDCDFQLDVPLPGQQGSTAPADTTASVSGADATGDQ